MLNEIDRPECVGLVVRRSPIRYGGVDQVAYRPSGYRGAEVDAIFGAELGIPGNEIAALREDGVI